MQWRRLHGTGWRLFPVNSLPYDTPTVAKMGRTAQLTFFARKIDLKGARFILAHVFLAVCLAEDVKLHILEPDPVP